MDAIAGPAATIDDQEGGTRLAGWTVQAILRLGPRWFVLASHREVLC